MTHLGWWVRAGGLCARGVLAVIVAAAFCGSIAVGQTPRLSVARSGDIHRIGLDDGTLIQSTTNAVAQARLIAVPGRDVLAAIWQENTPDQGYQAFYSISLDGRTFHPARQTSHRIRLRYAEFDPVASAAPEPAELAADGANNESYLVQFYTPPLEAYRQKIRTLGGRVQQFIADHTHFVQMRAEVSERVAALPFVRWVGPYHTAYRLEERLTAELAAGRSSVASRRYSIMVFERGPAQQNRVAERIEALGGRVHGTVPESFRLEATLTLDQLRRIAEMNEIMFIDVRGTPGLDMDIVREIGGANFIESAGGYTGQGVRGEIVDAGVLLTHPDFQSNPPIVHTVNGIPGAHGTATFGVLFGDGTGNPDARGLLPDAQGIVTYIYPLIGESNIGNRFAHTAELVDPDGPYRAVFQNTSGGDPQTTRYTTISAAMDDLLFVHDLVICNSMSNWASQMVRPQAWAKNIVSVGALSHWNTLTREDDCWGCMFGSASIGPAADGRVKPTLIFFFDYIFTTAHNGYAQYGGTSGATPSVAGHFGLLFQMWADGIFGNPVSGGDPFDERCHMTTAKAMIVNTAYRYDWHSGGANADLQRFYQGWGMPDLRALYDARENMLIIDESDLLAPFESAVYHVEVAAGEPLLRATLVYADPMGVPAALRHRINDLSLKVTSPSGVSYWGNNGLIDDNWSTPGGVPNEIDTVENVFIQNPEPGRWAVEVFAHEINQDSHVETPELDADFALVVTGITGVKGCVGDLDGDGDTDLGDLGILLADFGCIGGGCAGDVDGDGDTDLADLGILLADFGCTP